MSTYDKVVKSATKPKPGPPKPKYIDPIIATTFSSDGSLQDVCKALGQRLREPNATVVYKALIVLHTMIRNGAVDNVLGYLATEASGLRLRSVNSGSWQGYDAPQSISAYAQYLDERIRAYRELKHDVIRSSDSARTKGKGGSGSNRLRRLTVEKGLLREVAITQKVANTVLQCSFFLEDLNDELTLTAFRMALKDLLAVYTAINEGVINILEHYFEMAKSDAERALELYKRFCTQTEKVVAYLSSAKRSAYTLNVAIPNLKHAPVSLAGALEEYLNDPNFEQNRKEYKENKRIADGGAPAPKASVPASDSKKNITIKEPEKPVKNAVKPPTGNQALQDFFESIETEQTNMFSPSNSMNSINGGGIGVAPQQTGMGMGMGGMGMSNGMGMGFGGIQPQMTGYNPFMNQAGMMAPQMTGFPLQQQQQLFVQAQPTGFIQPQATGFNPFRQSVMAHPTGMGLTGAFGAGPEGSNMFGLPQTQVPQQQVQPQPSGNQVGTSAVGSNPAFSDFNSALGSFPAPSAGQPSSQNAGSNQLSGFNSSTSNANANSSTPKPLLSQKTGSRNPFAPPPGSTPPPSSPPPSEKGPSLNQLAMSAFATQNQGAGGNYGLGANAWDGSDPTKSGQQETASGGLKPQPTGLIGNVASEFALSSNRTASQVPSPSTSAGTAGMLTSNFDSLSLGGTSSTTAPPSSSASQPNATTIQAQPTGFGGVKAFQPSSNFGASLAAQVTGLGGQNGAFGGGGQGGSNFASQGQNPHPQGLPTQATGNPFARVGSPSIASGLTLGSSSGGLQSGLSPQPTGSFGASLFGQGATTHGTSNGATASSLNGVGNPTLTNQLTPSAGLQPQPTGFGGIKPFQPTSNFGQTTFGANPNGGPQGQSNLGSLF
ncbi:ANTH-domain-containing protein [Violaceomyces palustris]|uniref:ANTH-domain-containing protein n=1 Tax=Violaceomyces palustris TaxID=1673888 RepID=A0ACD0NRJ6_9BASI|nr:ANTH-domain-containing protein [Violaceomyces palustris]